MNAFRLAALTLLASGGLLLVLDIIENLLAHNWNGMAAGYLWSMIWPSSLRAVRGFVEGHISIFLWQRVFMPLLSMPLWSLMLIAGGILIFYGRRDDGTP